MIITRFEFESRCDKIKIQTFIKVLTHNTLVTSCIFNKTQFCCFAYIMSSFYNDLFFQFVENVDLFFWLIYYKQQIEKNYKKKIKFQVRIVKRSKFAIFISFVFDFVWKLFVMKIIETTSNQYEKKNYKKWKKYCKQMKNQFTQNNVNHII